ncbi:MAG: oligopeptide transporter, OPT family [bacterium]|nr:oligopeptide transporter, OPT family [bacterium]
MSFKPYIPPEQNPPELTIRALIIGSLFGFVFAATSVYLGLKIGLTVSASIPVAVLAISVLRWLGKSGVLENNIVQTVASAGESIGAGVVFTLPAVILLGYDLDYFTIFSLSILGGILGTLFMIPLRRSLIVKEHGVLPYPEGTACAEVLISGEKGGTTARHVFVGLGMGLVYTILMKVFSLWKTVPEYNPKWFKGASIRGEMAAELLGVGYIIGPRISGFMLSGGVVSWLVLIPLIKLFGQGVPDVFPPASGMTIAQMGPDDIWANYIRYIGGGAVVFGGIVTLMKALPVIWSAFRENFTGGKISQSSSTTTDTRPRTERDLPIMVTLVGIVVLVLLIALLPQIPGGVGMRLLAAGLIVFFGFFFVTVSSRITGLVGSTSNPISGMTITTLMFTALLFLALGWTGHQNAIVAILVGGVVCIAASNGGNTSQDLKTGYIVGATPRAQQISLVVGIVTSSLVIGLTLLYLHSTLGVGSKNLPAPKAQLMQLIVSGVLEQKLPWDLIWIGFFLGATMQLCGVEALPFAVGAYLPMEISTPIFMGGAIRWFIDKRTNGKKSASENESSPGVLFSSGLIAGGAIGGILWALQKGFENAGAGWAIAAGGVGDLLAWNHAHFGSEIAPCIAIGILCVFLYRAARKSE